MDFFLYERDAAEKHTNGSPKLPGIYKEQKDAPCRCHTDDSATAL